MTDREKLIALLMDTGMLENEQRCQIAADELIASGVTVREPGEWIFEEDEKVSWCTKAICTHCKTVVANNRHLALDCWQEDFVKINHYCPNCGARMEVNHETD